MPLFQERPELFESFLKGRREALDEVYRIYRVPVDVYLGRLSTRAGFEPARAFAVADLRQEAFLRAFSPRARVAYDPTRRYTPYLKTIARNCFIDALRLRRREALLFDDGDGGRSGDEPGVPFAGFGERDSEPGEAWDPRLHAILQSYLARLPPHLRAVYNQRYVCGESQEIACVTLGLSRRKLRTAEEQLKRGLRAALRQVYVPRASSPLPSLRT